MTSTATSLRTVSAPAKGAPAQRPAPRPAQRSARPAAVHLTTRGYLAVLVLLVLVVLGAFAIGRAASSHATEQVGSPGPAPTQRTVQQGDTLWSIAREVAPDRDPRDVVAQIRRLNHLSSASVQAGRQILLPAVV